MIKLPTSNSWWIFDDEHLRYRRIPRDMNPEAFAFDNEWEHYSVLEVDSDFSAFTVFLNEEKTRIMRGYVDPNEQEDLSKDISLLKA